MTKPSIISFAVSFEKMKHKLREQPSDDLRLPILIDHWPALRELTVDTGCQSYFDEYSAVLTVCVHKEALSDLLPGSLTQLLDTLYEIAETSTSSDKTEWLRETITLVAREAAKKLFYVGAVEDGLVCLAKAEGCETPTIDLSGVERELDALRQARVKLAEINSPLVEPVNSILGDWEVERDAASFDEAKCLLVEKKNGGEVVCGRMITLHGSANFREKRASNDEVTLDVEIVAQDDPLVGGLYDSIAAVRTKYASEWGYRNRYVRSRFEVGNSKYRFAGGSMGLAAALLSYVQLLQPEVVMHERSIATGAAFTGTINESGRLQPVDDNSLRWKVERAFFSPVQYLVLPRANYESASNYVTELQSRYPRRELQIVAAKSLQEVIDHMSIVRAEKLCAFRYVTRTVKKYTRATKVQVPILVVGLYMLLCVIYPKAWVGFDRNPGAVTLESRGFAVLNSGGQFLWRETYECDSLRRQSKHAVSDLDGDGLNEVLVAPTALGSPCDHTSVLHVYEHSGELRFTCDCVILNQYPGDTARYMRYAAGQPNVIYQNMDTIIETSATKSYPSRAHIKLWDAQGRPLGWYVHAGALTYETSRDFDGDGKEELLFTGINSRYQCGMVLVLESDSVYGVSPPYDDSMIAGLSDVRQGNQTHYILFPPSDLCVYSGTDHNNGTGNFQVDEGSLYLLLSVEVAKPGGGTQAAYLNYYLTPDLRVDHVNADDLFLELRHSVVRAGELPAVAMSAYLANLRDAVRYWTDSGWVTEGQLRAEEDSL